MADLNYTADINTRPARQSLKKLQGSVSNTSATFDRLKGAIAGIGIATLIQQSGQLASVMSNIARATDISLASVTGFSQALIQAGGTAERAADGISDFTKNVGEAAQGSSELQNTFGRLNITLDELAKLSNEDLFRLTVERLGEVTDASERSAIAQRLFGESLKGVDVVSVANNLSTLSERNKETADAIQQAADVSERLSAAYFTLRIEILSSLQPVADFALAITDNQDAVRGLIKLLVELASIAASFFLIGRALRVLGAVFKTLGAIGGTVFRVFGRISEEITALGKFISDNIPFITAFTAVFSRLFDAVIKAADAFARFIGLKSDIESTGEALDDAGSNAAEAGEAAANAGRQVIDALDQQRRSLDSLVGGYNRQNEQLLENLKRQRDQIGLTDDQIEKENAVFRLRQQLGTQIQQLKDRRESLNAEEEKNIPIIELINERIAELVEKEAELVPQVRQVAEEIIRKRNAMEAANEQAERFKKSMEDAGRAIESTNSFVEDLQQQTSDAAYEMRTANMGPLEKQISDINRKIDQDLKTSIEELQSLSNEQNYQIIEQQIERLRQAARKQAEQQAEIARKAYEQQREFSTGWSRAFRDYEESATNAAETAQNIFEKTTKGMEDAIVGFAKTGKFEFKGFINSILEELLRSQIRQIIAKTFSIGGLGGGGGGGGLGSLFGGFFATGGMIPPGRVGVVGESGPELVSGPANVSTIEPQQVVYNINAVDATSFKQLVAQDPQFIHAVATQGSKGIPGRR